MAWTAGKIDHGMWRSASWAWVWLSKKASTSAGLVAKTAAGHDNDQERKHSIADEGSMI
jgi:hypothetical protein